MAMMTDAALRRAMTEGAKRTIVDPGRRGDGRLLAMIRPMPSGALVEFYARQIEAGRKRLVKLGTYPGMSLSQARAAFQALSPAIRQGENLRHHRDRQRIERRQLGTLQELCEGFAASLEAAGRRSGYEVRRALVHCPSSATRAIGADRPACDVTAADVADWLRPIHRRAPAAARQARAWLSAAYTWGLKREHDYATDQAQRWGLTGNPAAGVPAHTVSARAGTRYLSREEFARVWRWLASEGGRSDQRACNALRIMMATGQRVEEILYLRAGQYDGAWLRWPKTKNGSAHSIPVPAQARVILDAMTPTVHGIYVPGVKRPHLPYRDKSLVWIAHRCAKQLGIERWTGRDLRRTWRTLAGDAGLNAEECARLMNHAYGSRIEAKHYDKGDNAAIKLAGMAKWEKALAELLETKNPA